jgi:hypothetical protein
VSCGSNEAGYGFDCAVFWVGAACDTTVAEETGLIICVALNVGFYYMANAAGRLLGTLASGVVFQLAGFAGCLWGSAALVLAAAVLSLRLPKGHPISLASASVGEGE